MNKTMIEAGALAKAIADHITPIKKGCHVKNIGKATCEHHPEHPNNWRHEDLSLDDSKLLAEIWSKNGLPFDCPIEQADWPKYKTAFDGSPDRPNWELTCGFNDWYIITRSENIQSAIQHQKAIEAAASRGELRLFTANLVPTGKVEYGSLIRRDDAVRYLDSIGLPASILKEQNQEQRTEQARPEAKEKRPVGAPRKADRIENHLDEITADAKEAASTMHSPTNALVIKRLKAIDKWKDRFSDRDWDKTILNYVWQK